MGRYLRQAAELARLKMELRSYLDECLQDGFDPSLVYDRVEGAIGNAENE